MTDVKIFEKLRQYLEKDPEVIFAVIFGSYARGEAKKDSDIDLGIFFSRPPEGLELFDLMNRLSEIAGRDVHLVVLNKASPFLRHQVMKSRIVLTLKDRTIYRRFREKTISDYDEYKYISGMNLYD